MAGRGILEGGGGLKEGWGRLEDARLYKEVKRSNCTVAVKPPGC